MAGQHIGVLPVRFTVYCAGYSDTCSIECQQPRDGRPSECRTWSFVCACQPELQQLDQCQCIYCPTCRHRWKRISYRIVRPKAEEYGLLAVQGLPTPREDEAAVPGGGL